VDFSTDERTPIGGSATGRDGSMPVYLLADEFAMSSSVALAVCDQAGVHAESGATVLGPQDVERFRIAARHGAPATAPTGPAWAVPIAGTPTPTAPAAPAAAGPAWAVPAAPAGPAGPNPAPGPTGATGATGASGATGPAWATPQPTASPAPHAPPTGAGPPAGHWASPQPANGPGRPGAPDIDPQLWGRLQRSRSAASTAMLSGLGLILLGIAITVGTFIIAPGGFFIVSFGPVLAGFSQISKAQRYRAEVARVERALHRYA